MLCPTVLKSVGPVEKPTPADGKRFHRKEAYGTKSLPLRFWHATPLHYVPHLLLSGGLLSKARLKAAGLPIRPRPTAVRRDWKLGLADYIHLSPAPVTPLLADKRARGFAHVLIEFDAAVAELPGTGFLKFNTKSWRHREAFLPVAPPEEKAALLHAWRGGKYPSLELLVPGALPLAPYSPGLHAVSETEAAWISAFAAVPGISWFPPIFVTPGHFPPGPAPDLSPHAAYLAACLAVGAVLPPPELPFD